MLRSIEEELRSGSDTDRARIDMLLRNAGELIDIGPPAASSTENHESLIRRINSARHAILNHFGENPAEWDLLPPLRAPLRAPLHTPLHTPQHGSTSAPRHVSRCVGEDGRYRGDERFRVYIDDIRSPFNVGSIFRTAAAFCVAEVLLSEYCARPDHPRAVRSSMGAVDLLPWRVADAADLGLNQEPAAIFALETGGTVLSEFRFPETGIIILGNEELGISPDCSHIARARGGICSIELPGPKTSVNVSVAFGIAMHEWSRRIHE